MSERLKQSEIFDFINAYAAAPNATGRDELFTAFCDRIAGDRDAIRAETREELLKDHFKLGEWLEMTNPFDERNKLVQVLPVFKANEVQHAGLGVRRPPKKRAMTDEELRHAFKASEKSAQYVADKLKPSTIKDILEAHGFPTEVEE